MRKKLVKKKQQRQNKNVTLTDVGLSDVRMDHNRLSIESRLMFSLTILLISLFHKSVSLGCSWENLYT